MIKTGQYQSIHFNSSYFLYLFRIENKSLLISPLNIDFLRIDFE